MPRIWVVVTALFVVSGIAWTAWCREYYAWVLQRQPAADVVVFCDTSELDPADLQAWLFYDAVALSPVARGLGIFQQRKTGAVTSFFYLQAESVEITSFSATLRAIPQGPLAKVKFVSRGKQFFAEVTDRRVVKGKIVVRVEE
ncbi:MAG: hypothetical protein HY343_02390 [Lentisphaerae bacterium]|nr:hypothetical protein [Lentisphaerota bacterium]